MKLSVMVCVKNEEQLLGRCLDSVRPVADELIVVDTGSTDGTVEVARRHGANLYAWTGGESFLEAWNLALERCRGDWVLNLDGDETIERSDLPELRRLLYRKDVDAFVLPIRNYSCTMDLMWDWHANDGSCPEEEAFSGCPGSWRSHALRLFRRLDGVSFRQGETNHTSPDASIHRLGLPVGRADLTLHNLGWLKGGDRYLMEKNVARLDGELRHAKKRAPDHVNIAKTYLCLGEDPRALEHVELALALEPELVDALYVGGMIGKESGQLELAQDYLLRALAQEPDHADAWTVLGMVCDLDDRPQEAEGALRRALRLRPRHPLALNSLGVVLESLGRPAEAEQAYRAALAAHPRHPYALENLASLCGDEEMRRLALSVQLTPPVPGEARKAPE